MKTEKEKNLRKLAAMSEPYAPEWDWGYCICCGSLDVTDRAFHVSRSFEILRTAWCAAPECQEDHGNFDGPDIPREWKA